MTSTSDSSSHTETAQAGVCQCASGWTGESCDIVKISPGSGTGATAACDGVVDQHGECCMGPIDRETGVCCPEGANVDSAGRCCDVGEGVDVCGVCGGRGVAVDVEGVCCPYALTSAQTCCMQGVDSCGVCGGRNECMSNVKVSVSGDSLDAGGFNSSTMVAALGLEDVDVLGVSLEAGGSLRRMLLFPGEAGPSTTTTTTQVAEWSGETTRRGLEGTSSVSHGDGDGDGDGDGGEASRSVCSVMLPRNVFRVVVC